MKIEFGKFLLNDSSKRHLDEVFQSNWFTQGPKVREFETRFASILKAPYCRMVSSGTTADTIACMALYEHGAKQGDEIICPALSFIATANSIRLAGFVPVFVDIKGGDDLNIDTDLIERAITSKTRAIMAVNLMGRPADLDIIQDVALRHNLKVIVDGCESYGCTYKGKPSLAYGDFETTSHFTAHICMVGGESGCVLTKDYENDKLVEAIRSHGRLGGSLFFDHPIFGLNGKSSDLYAAIGLGELDLFWENFYIRRSNIIYFYESLKEYSDLVWMNQPDDDVRFNAPHAFSVVFKNPKNSSLFKEQMDLAEIHIKKNFGSMPSHGAFKYLKNGEFPVAEYCGNNGWHWGCHRYLSNLDLEYIVDSVKESFSRMTV